MNALHDLRWAARLALALAFVAASTASFAGDGRVDAGNGDTYFNVHFRFPPTPQQVTDVKATLDMMAFGLCDASDGQWRVKRITLSQGQANEDRGDFWLHALPGRSGLSFFANGSNLGTLGSHVDMFSGALLAPDVYLHEFGHHAWGLGDEYDEQQRFGGPCGIGPGFEPGTIDEQNHSIMQQSGSAQCVGGARNGQACFRDGDCPAAAGGAAGACRFVLMSELSVASNNDPLQGDGNNCPAVAPPGVACPDNAYCMRAWNAGTTRYEQTQQSELHNDESDWETLDKNYPFVTPPTALPVAAAPATCFRAVEYQDDVVGADQVLLVLDRSGSMSWSSNPADQDVCANGVDDDGDGGIDEATCGNARITFVKAAANAYLDLQRDRGIEVGVMSFATTPLLDRAIGALDAGNIAAYKAIVDGLAPGGNTGIGDAMRDALPEFTRVAALGRSRTAYLMTDGINTSGSDPAAAADALRDIGVRVHVIPAGNDVNADQLSGIAATTGGDLLAAPTLNDLTAIYAELAGRHRGAAMALPRTDFELSLRGVAQEQPQEGGRPKRERSFPIPVEKNAEALTAFVSGRNLRISDWSTQIRLLGPNGEAFGPGSPELTSTPYYVFISVRNPTPGEWKLVASATGAALQQATALAFIDNPAPDFFVDARPKRLRAGEQASIAASPSFVARLDDQAVSIVGRVDGPGGYSAPLTVRRNATGAWSADAGPFPFNGFYRATLTLDVGPGAALAKGESIFSGPETPPVAVDPFVRHASTGFLVVEGRDPPCTSGRRGDCDGDGIPDTRECRGFPQDIDGDGRPNGLDTDADGDEIPDAIERKLDSNGNRVPDLCERNEPRTAQPPRDRPGRGCVPVRRELLEVVRVGNAWQVVDGNVALYDYAGDESGARKALEALRRLAVTHICHAGERPRSLGYLLANGLAPRDGAAGETCTTLDPQRLEVVRSRQGLALRSRRAVVREFADRADAEAAAAMIRSEGFTRYCTIGRGPRVLEFLRR